MELQGHSDTGIVVDKRYLGHDTGTYHPESPQRLEAIYKMLETPEMRPAFTHIEPRIALVEEIEMIHRSSYIARVAATAGGKSTTLDPDTVVSSDSYEVALLAAGGLLSAVDAIMTGTIRNAFALIRPPGHHAESNRSAGFCIFNNVAVAAAYVRAIYGLTRILIVDWDVHHGNGTQYAFYENPEVLYFSTHQYHLLSRFGAASTKQVGVRGKATRSTCRFPGDRETVNFSRFIKDSRTRGLCLQSTVHIYFGRIRYLRKGSSRRNDEGVTAGVCRLDPCRPRHCAKVFRGTAGSHSGRRIQHRGDDPVHQGRF